jgi:hypothetical protein
MKHENKMALIAIGLWVLFLALAFSYPAQASSLDYTAYANKIEAKYELPKNLVVAICSYENRSRIWKNVAGRHGEIGVCQIKPDTARMVCPECIGEPDHIVFGSIGDAVRIVQRAAGVPIDGIFGPQTLQGVIKFQQTKGLIPDGVVGNKTWYAMTGKKMYVNSIEQQLWNPEKNIEFAAKYLVWLRNFLGDDLSMVIAAYNGGLGHPLIIYASKVQVLLRDME